MDLIIEIESRAGRSQFEKLSFQAGVIRLGRAFDNDCILSEGHVSEHHGQLRRDDSGRWWYEDLHSLNGSFDSRGKRIKAAMEMHSGDELLLGRVRLRLLAPEHPVNRTLALSRWHHLLGLLQHPLALALQILVAGSLFLLNQSLTEFDQPRWGKHFGDMFWFFGILLVWAGFWSSLGKLLRHEARFAAHLVVGNALLVFGVLADWATQVLAFNSTNTLLSLVTDSLLGALLLGCMAAMSLQLALHARHWRLRLGAHAASWILVGFFSVKPFQAYLDFSGHPQYIGELAPPAMRWHPAVSPETFLSDAEKVLAKPAQ